ncbi:MAG TPA: phosphatidylinositol-specific phospholipase C [Rubellimicrobium sp.]|jgi:1-phosphatidylinositol phosphodiesterase|nr:phosphatidylinositol-specific phospholipase C [Rubellimicrobium sp.]
MTFDVTQWMSYVEDSKKLTELSIPGTHDSGSRNQGNLKLDRLETQTRTIRAQLDGGIRFLDIRVGYTETEFRLYHEDVYLNLNFGQVRDICRDFLKSNPRETIIMSLKKEDDAPNSGNKEGITFQARFNQYVGETPTLWYTRNTIPTLGEVRGKIVLFRRFKLDGDKNAILGINAYDGFPDNGTDTINDNPLTGQPKLRIQDDYGLLLTKITTKWGNVEKILKEAVAPGHKDVLYVNFASAAGKLERDYPKSAASYINPRLLDYFSGKKQGRFGIVVMDFETTELNTRIAHTNVPFDVGYWIVDGNAKVTALGSAEAYRPAGAAATEAIAIAARENGTGYYLLTLDGSVYAYGDTDNKAGQGVPRDTRAASISVKPTSVSPSGLGYWVLADNGIVRAYNATSYGRIESGTNLQALSLVATPDARGYWILASNGRIHAFGSAENFGDRRDAGPGAGQLAVAMAATPDGKGYWILSTNGTVFRYGTARHFGQGVGPGETARAMAATKDGLGYWILSTNGNVHAYGNAGYVGRATTVSEAVGIAVRA